MTPRTPAAARRAVARAAATAAVLATGLVACSAGSGDEPSSDPSAQDPDRPIGCGLVDRALVEDVAGSTELSSTRVDEPAPSGEVDVSCSTRSDRAGTARVDIVARTVDPATTTSQIEPETRRDPDQCSRAQSPRARIATTCRRPAVATANGVWAGHLVRVVLTPPRGSAPDAALAASALSVAEAVADGLDSAP